VSKLCKFAACQNRSKIELFNKLDYSSNTKASKNAMSLGTKLHEIYSKHHGSFDRLRLRVELARFYGMVLQRQILIDNIQVMLRGIYDDLIVNFNPLTQAKTVSLIEVKTTSKPRLTRQEIASAILQLQTYVYMMKPMLQSLGWVLDDTHFVEVYSQKTYKLIQKVPVAEHADMENYIKYMVEVFLGLAPKQYPPEYVCRTCPKNVKLKCGRYLANHKINK